MAKKKAAPQEWRNRIVGNGTMAASQFMANPANARIHPKAQQEALTGSLREIGWIQNVIVNKTTGNVVDGHARIAEALKMGDETPVPYVEVELSEAEEKLALASLDPIAAMAAYDKQQLDALLRDVNTGEAGLQAMLADLANKNGLGEGNNIDELWQGMPEFIQEDKLGFHEIKIHFETEEDMKSFGLLIGQTITDKTKSTWFPYKEKENLKAYKAEDES